MSKYTWISLAILFMSYIFLAPKTFNYFVFPSFDLVYILNRQKKKDKRTNNDLQNTTQNKLTIEQHEPHWNQLGYVL